MTKNQKINTAIVSILLACTTTVIAKERNPEIANHRYTSLEIFNLHCYADAKKDIRQAFANDGVIREDEYFTILRKCNTASEKKFSNAKANLRKAIK